MTCLAFTLCIFFIFLKIKKFYTFNHSFGDRVFFLFYKKNKSKGIPHTRAKRIVKLKIKISASVYMTISKKKKKCIYGKFYFRQTNSKSPYFYGSEKLPPAALCQSAKMWFKSMYINQLPTYKKDKKSSLIKTTKDI